MDKFGGFIDDLVKSGEGESEREGEGGEGGGESQEREFAEWLSL